MNESRQVLNNLNSLRPVTTGKKYRVGGGGYTMERDIDSTFIRGSGGINSNILSPKSNNDHNRSAFID